MDAELHKKINEQYQVGNSIQAIARTHRVEVSEVLEAIGQTEMLVLETVGDLVDEAETAPGTVLNITNKHRVAFTTN